MDIKRVGDHTIWKCVYSGAIHGVIAWTVYAIVECWFSTILPWIIKPGYEYHQLHFGITVLLFLLYTILGLTLGGISGFCIRAVSGRIPFLQNAQSTVILPAAATSTVVFTFVINFIFRSDLDLTTSVLLLGYMLLLLGIVLSMRSMVWSRRLCFITNPWTTIILLLGLSWLTLELFNSQLTKGISALAYILVILLISFFIQKIADRRQIDKSAVTKPSSLVKSLACLTFIWLITFGISLFAKHIPLQVNTTVKPLPQDANHPNVVLITMDTVRADHLSLYGYERDTTPALRQFSKEATLYSNSFASGDMTLSTHASIFTGMYTSQHGAHSDPWKGQMFGRPLADKFHTLAEILSEKGYLTIGVVANCGWLGISHGLCQGFNYYDVRGHNLSLIDGTQKFYLRNSINKSLELLRSFALPSVPGWRVCRAEEINREAFTLLDKVQKSNETFFFFINYMDAHIPYFPPSPFDTIYPGKDKTFSWHHYYKPFREKVLKLKRKVTKKEYDHLVSQYDGGIAYLDFHLGKLFAQLKKLGLYDNTLIMITSDHGEVFGRRNLLEHGVSVYQDQVYIPLIIKYPNIKKKHVVGELTSSIDLMPTILDVLNYDIPEQVQGQSLLNHELGKSKSVISESFPYGFLRNWHPKFDRIERAVFSGSYKLISSTAGKRELYDLSKDPNERKNLYQIYNDIASELEARLNQYLETVVVESSLPTKLDKDARKKLKALGYIQ